MAKSVSENRRILSILLVFSFAFGPMVLEGCKKKDQPREAQQTVESQKTEAVSPSKPNEPSDQVSQAGPTEKIDLRILYAGLLNTDRAKDFENFLSKHFKQVGTTDYDTFTGDQSADFDVTIIDHNGVGFRPPLPKISRQYTRATITMGVPGAFLCDRLSLKTGYL